MIFTIKPRYIQGEAIFIPKVFNLPSKQSVQCTGFEIKRDDRTSYYVSPVFSSVPSVTHYDTDREKLVLECASKYIREILQQTSENSFICDVGYTSIAIFMLGLKRRFTANDTSLKVFFRSANKFNQFLHFLNKNFDKFIDRYKNMNTYCEVCDSEVPYVEGAVNMNICSHCQSSGVVKCADCGTHTSEAKYKIYSNTKKAFCIECFNSKFYTCPSCKETSELREICGCGYDKVMRRYSYKPNNLKFLGFGMYYGVEIEVELSNKKTNVQDIINELLDYEHFYYKADGSLDYGLEFVSHPCTVDYHKKHTMPMLEKLQTLGIQSDSADTCGLHIHIGKAQLGSTREQLENTTVNMMFMLDKYWEDVVIFTRRSKEKINKWSSNYIHNVFNKMSGKSIAEMLYNNKTIDKEQVFHEAYSKIVKTNSNSQDKYKSVNIKNEHTCELRIFQSTTTPFVFMATLQFVDALVELCKQSTMADLHVLDGKLSSILNMENREELKKYMLEKNI